MQHLCFNDGWSVRPKGGSFAEIAGLTAEWTPVTLPHDAMIGTERSESAGSATGYFTDGTWEYRKTFAVPADEADGVHLVEFEGVYRDALVFVNGQLAAHRPYGYSGFTVPVDHLLRAGAENELRVEVRTHADSRWYPGAGIHRPVWWLRGPRVHLAPDGLTVRTPDIDDERAVVEVAAVVRNQSVVTSTATARIEIEDATGTVVARDEAPVTTFPGDALPARARLVVHTPNRWGPGHPYLYTCRVTLLDGSDPLDEESTAFGIRSLSLDPQHGLRINGETVLLRGACIHHDNGVLGAAAIDRAEERRVERLKAAGFNALRSAHNPMSRAMLAACDRLGVIVMDEAFDMWTQPKSHDDYAVRFADWWEADIEAMVRKDVNHPCVVFYSTGNEIPEIGTPAGARWGRILAERVRALDPTRFVTNAISGLLASGPELFQTLDLPAPPTLDAPDAPATSDEANATLTDMWDSINQLMRSPVVAAKTEEACAPLDVAGYNYMEARFDLDAELYPHRMLVGSETHPVSIDTGWAAVVRHPHVIGDFTWTGWDYLGEAGIGRVEYAGDPGAATGFGGAYPWLTAWCGDIDITGHRRPQSYYREIVFGLRRDPYLAVRRPEHHGKAVVFSTPWSWSDTVASWSWPGHEGAPVVVEVYADADEVELLVNGRSAGRRPAGAQARYRATFEVTYEPGEVLAVAWRGGGEVGRTALRSASGPVLLDVRADRAEIRADPSDLAFVDVTLVDAAGALYTGTDRKVTFDVAGPAVLQGCGSADPRTEERFTEPSCTTFDGRALAVVRPTGGGTITLAARADGCEPQQVEIAARG